MDEEMIFSAPIEMNHQVPTFNNSVTENNK